MPILGTLEALSFLPNCILCFWLKSIIVESSKFAKIIDKSYRFDVYFYMDYYVSEAIPVLHPCFYAVSNYGVSP